MQRQSLEIRRFISFSPDILRNSRLLFISFFFAFVLLSQAASLNISGNHRFGSNLFYNMDLDSGKANGTSNSSAYLEHRLLLKPEVAIDEHFSVKSTWNLFQLNSYPTSSNTTPTRFGSPLDSTNTNRNSKQLFEVRSAYLNWSSDFGIFRRYRIKFLSPMT